jgi:glycosyltransferase involved in cell wall biosynthesis
MIRAADDRHEITIIPNGVDLEAFRPGDPVPDDGPLRVLCVARLIERKGQHHLIQAVGRLIDEGLNVQLELVGTGDAEPKLKAQVRGMGLEGHVSFAGYVPREKIAAHYAAAHVFVLPSYNEGMSVATLEAMAAGLPLILTRTGGTAELLAEGINGFSFEWADVTTLNTHLRTLVRDRELTRLMSIASRDRAPTFCWSAASSAYLELLHLVQGLKVNSPRRTGSEASFAQAALPPGAAEESQ